MRPLQFEPREHSLFSHFSSVAPVSRPHALFRREHKRVAGISKKAELMILLILGADPAKVRKKAAPMSDEEWRDLMTAFADHVQFVEFLKRREAEGHEAMRRRSEPA